MDFNQFIIMKHELLLTIIAMVLLVAELLNVNPYDQPAVEDIKVNTLSRLKK